MVGNDQARLASDHERPALAVLPFDNLSGDPAQAYFSDGLTEDIITDLAGQHELLVIARNSSFVYRDTPTDVRTVGAELGADYVVEGSARRAGDQLRVTAQLVETDTGAHLWSESYDRPGEDVFAVQADLTAQIVAALVSHVQRSEVEAVLARPTESLRAYELVLQGRHEHNVLTADSLLRARDLFTRAVALDPSYAAAHAYLGMTYVKDHALALTGSAHARQLQTGIDHIREAIRLQPDLALGYQALSFALAQTGEYESALRAAERAVQLSPSDPDTLEALAKAQVRFGAYEDAVANAERALRLHPFAPPYYTYVYGQALYAAGRYEEADNVLRQCLLRVPDERSCLRMQAAVLVRLDRLEEARTAMAHLKAIDPAFSLSAERRIERFGASPVMDRYLADLKVAGTSAAGQARTATPSNRSA